MTTDREAFEVWYLETYHEKANCGFAAGDWAAWKAALAFARKGREEEIEKMKDNLKDYKDACTQKQELI